MAVYEQPSRELNVRKWIPRRPANQASQPWTPQHAALLISFRSVYGGGAERTRIWTLRGRNAWNLGKLVASPFVSLNRERSLPRSESIVPERRKPVDGATAANTVLGLRPGYARERDRRPSPCAAHRSRRDRTVANALIWSTCHALFLDRTGNENRNSYSPLPRSLTWPVPPPFRFPNRNVVGKLPSASSLRRCVC